MSTTARRAPAWGLVRGYGEAECWCIVHVPTGRTVWRVASPALALAMLDELGLMVPAYEADRALGEAVDGHTREAKRVRRPDRDDGDPLGARRGPALAGGAAMTYRCTACQTDEHPREAHTDLHKAIDAMYRAFERKDWNGLTCVD